jgi:hypothetical protein
MGIFKMPSFFNLQNFYEKHKGEIDQLREIFPQFDPDEVTLLFYENNCDVNLILTRLSSGETFKRKLSRNIAENKKKKLAFENSEKVQDKVSDNTDSIIPSKSLSKKEEPMCVNFLFNQGETRLIELPPVVFPFCVPDCSSTSLPVFYSFCSKY